jgi:hypothetical protein
MEEFSQNNPWNPKRPVYPAQMSFEEFENLARLYVVGALEDGEQEAFQEAIEQFGDRAEQAIAGFRQLNSVFALSLRPHPPHPDTKRKLLHAVRRSMDGSQNLNDRPDPSDSPGTTGEITGER